MPSAHDDPTNRHECPTRVELAAFIRGELAPADKDAVGRHLAACDSCGTFVREIAAKPSGATDRPHSTEGRFQGASNAEATDADPSLSSLFVGAGATVVHQRVSAQAVKLPLILGQYRLIEQIGAGGMGAVYSAEHLHLKKLVAVKLLPPDRMTDPSAQARFRREMQVVGRLDHPNIVRATDAGETNGAHFLAMEFIDGNNLAQIVRRTGPLPLADACEIIRQAALGLQHAHENGLVHRDLKPHNLMLTRRGEVKILDLGLALLQGEHKLPQGLTGIGQVMGTADYMAPEQWEDSHQVDIRADLYSLGCTLYYLLTGRPPFSNSSVVQKMASHLRDEADPLPSGAAAAAPVLESLMAKAPADRPRSPAELVRELTPLARNADLQRIFENAKTDGGADHTSSALMGGHSVTTAVANQATSSFEPRPRITRRRKFVAAALIAMLLALASIAAIHLTRDEPKSEAVKTDISGQPPPPMNGPPPSAVLEINPDVPLLRAAPEKRLWPRGDSVFVHNPERETVSIQAFTTALLRLGEATAPEYRLEIGFRQTTWRGNFGVYIGGHQDPQDGHFRYQVVHLTRLFANKLLVARTRGKVMPDPLGGLGALLTGFASEDVKTPPGLTAVLLEIEVKKPNRMTVRFNGDEYVNIMNARFAKDVDESDYHGEFGIFCHGECTVTTARLGRPRPMSPNTD